MTSFLPIVGRELRLASRRRSTYWIRVCAAGLVGGVLFGLVLSTNEPASRVSPMAFMFLKVLCFAYSLLAGVRYTADALSRERREGTLGLLFLTDLRGYDVVVGKMVITSLNAFFGLLAALPLLAVPVLMGGVAVGEFWRTTLVLANALLFSLGIGLVVSAFGSEERKVLLVTLLLILGITFGLPASWSGVRRLWDPPWLEQLMLFPSPAYALQVSASGLFVAVPSRFWPSMATVAALTLLSLSIASWRLPRSIQEPDEGPRRTDQPTRPPPTGTGELSVEHWAQLRCVPPYFWRLCRGRTTFGWPLCIGGVTGVFAIYTLMSIPAMGAGGPRSEVVFGWFGLHWLFKFLIALESTRPFSEDKQCRALELLLASPLRPSQMIRAQGRRIFRLFVFPVAVTCVANLLISAAINDRVLSAMFFMGSILLPADCWALHWCGMHYSLACSSFTRGVFAALWRVLVPPALVFFVIVLGMASTNAPERVFQNSYIFWAVCAVIYDTALMGAKSLTLALRFRRLAAEEEAPRPFWFLLSRASAGTPMPSSAVGG